MPEQLSDPGNGRNYWRSLQQLADSEDFQRQLESEFPTGIEPPADGLNRRRFLQIMAASVAMTGLAACRFPEREIVPFSHRPAGVTPGVTRQYATAQQLAGVASPLLATSYDGRPIKIDGNPEHALSNGAADVFAQASVLDLYSPDRSRSPRRLLDGQSVTRSWDDFLAFAADHFGNAGGGGRGIAILAEASTSPALAMAWQDFRRAFPNARWFSYEPLSDDNALRGARLAFGTPYRPRYDLSQAEVIVDCDANLLQADATAQSNARAFARGRRPETGHMNRLYVFENSLTVTGGMADHRFPTPQADIPLVVASLAAELFLAQGLALPSGAGSLLSDLGRVQRLQYRNEEIAAIARDLLAHRGAGLVTVGMRQPADTHALCHIINRALDSAGKTVSYTAAAELGRGAETHAPIEELTTALNSGLVDTLLILGGNPVYNAPVDLEFATALGRAGTTIHLSDHVDATSAVCDWHLNRAHYLESWGDLIAPDGSYLAVQPLIEPLYAGKTDTEVLAAVAALQAGGDLPTAHDITRRSFHLRSGGRGAAPTSNSAFEKRWRSFIHDGYLQGSAADAAAPGLSVGRLNLPQGASALGHGNLEVAFAADPCLLDGRFADNAWLQELPDYMTKLTWDNAALLGPDTAAAFGVEHGDLIEIHWQDRHLEMPVYILPGQAPWSVTLPLGYGRADAGRVGKDVGFDTYQLRPYAAFWGGSGASLQKTGGSYTLATTQDHHAIDTRGYEERERRVPALVRETDLAHYEEHPDFVAHMGIHHPPLESLWKERGYEGYKWGMSIDLGSCIGCNACVVACQAENNIPVVGKDQVSRGREMHWIRLDRYFTGDPEDPEVAHQPVGCVHCEMAPCEGVCPVAATVHTDEGLNVMAYNRCVGTRYCANNCPYKVRRFNFYNLQDKVEQPQQLVYNPEVSIRARGVMEKCTYCVQRIQSAKIAAAGDGRRQVQDGEIVTACQQTCPTEAIVFGDLNDPESRVSKLRDNKRSYDMLAYLNIKPRTSYMGRVRNPNPELQPAHHDGHDEHDGEDTHGNDTHGNDTHGDSHNEHGHG